MTAFLAYAALAWLAVCAGCLLELLVAENDRSTVAQWEHLARLCGDSDRACCKVLKDAGAPMATQRYVTKAVMSRAIEIAKAA